MLLMALFHDARIDILNKGYAKIKFKYIKTPESSLNVTRTIYKSH